MGRCGGKTSNENENEVTATHGWEHCLGYRRRVGVSRRVVSRHGDEAGRRSRSGTRSMIPVKVGSVVYPGDGVIHVSLSLFLSLSLSLCPTPGRRGVGPLGSFFHHCDGYLSLYSRSKRYRTRFLFGSLR